MDYLMGFLEDFKGIDRASRGKNTRMKQFFHVVTSGFWKKFEWQTFRDGCKMPKTGRLTEPMVISDVNSVSYFAAECN